MEIHTVKNREDVGLTNQDIGDFITTPVRSVTREHAQNSNDASNKKDTVKLTFKIIEINEDEFPRKKEFEEVLKGGKLFSEKENQERDIDFYENAIQSIKGEKIKVLQIIDQNTTGVGKLSDGRDLFKTLVYTKGLTNKPDPTSGGSFGLGKWSAFAPSQVRTVFYSTLYEDQEGNKKFQAAGKSRLSSWYKDREQYSENIWWGKDSDGYLRIDNEDHAPKWLKRDDLGLGLTTNIIAPIEELCDKGNKKLITELIINFYKAILDKNIEFDINGETLNNENIKEELEKLIENHPEKDSGNNFEFKQLMITHNMINVLSQKKPHEAKIEIPEVGEFLLTFTKDNVENIKKVQIIRNGMIITDNLKNGFNDTLQKFRNMPYFAAIIEPLGGASTWIKKLENPKHDDLTPEYLPDDQKKLAVKKLNSLCKKIRQELRILQERSDGDTATLDEIDEYIKGKKDNSPNKNIDKKTGSTKEKEKIRIVTKGNESQKKDNVYDDDGEKTKRKRKGKKTVRKKQGKSKNFLKTQSSIKVIGYDPDDALLKKVFLKKTNLGKKRIEFYRVGRTSKEPLELKSVSSEGCKIIGKDKNIIEVENNKNEDIYLEIMNQAPVIETEVFIYQD